MKKQELKSIYTTIAFLTLAAISSCKKYEAEPLSLIDKELTYDEKDVRGVYLQQRVVSLYTGLPNGFNRIGGVPLDAATDDAIASNFNATTEILSKSRLTATLNPDDNWAAAYTSIRNVNDYLANEVKVPLDATLKNYFRAEARFIRAMNYFELIKRYGGVPLIGDKVYDGNQVIDVPRNSYDECVQYIVSECNAIAGSLRTNNSTAEGVLTGNNVGRISRGAAQALKARVLLYAASPLNNPANNLTKWSDAATAARDLMTSSPAYSLMGSFLNLFVTRNTNPEVILGYQNAASIALETQNSPVGYVLPNASSGLVSPTQELVNAFPGANGFPIDNPASLYNASNPYANRDPRLALTVFFNGITWLNRPVETFEGGLDKPTGIRGSTRTGYYQRKFLGNFATATNYTAQQRQFPIFRYAEVLLNYAEAINETGNQTEAFNQLKALRIRVGIPVGSVAGYQHGLKTTMNQAEMREAIRNERRIEMAFEEQRFWDIRRWKIAETVNNSEVHGMKIVKNPDNTFSYQTFTADKLNFSAVKNYLYPIPVNEVVSNPSMNNQQNPGY